MGRIREINSSIPVPLKESSLSSPGPLIPCVYFRSKICMIESCSAVNPLKRKENV